MSEYQGWIGVDLDGTLAQYDGWVDLMHIGDPIPAMVARVKAWVEAGEDIRIFTARAGVSLALDRRIQDWCELHIGARLPVTNVKDFKTLMIFDDRARQVEFNTGAILTPEGWQ